MLPSNLMTIAQIVMTKVAATNLKLILVYV